MSSQISSSKKAAFTEMEKELNEELMQMRASGVNINSDLIIAHARAIADRKKIFHFRGSSGWLSKFLER